MRGLIRSVFTFCGLLAYIADGEQMFGVSVENTGFHLLDFEFDNGTFYAYLYRRGELVVMLDLLETETVAELHREMKLFGLNKELPLLESPHVDIVKEELQVWMDSLSLFGVRGLCVTDIGSDALGAVVTMKPSNRSLVDTKSLTHIRNTMLNFGLDVARSKNIAIKIRGIVYRHYHLAPWIKEYEDTNSAEYNNVTRELNQMVTDALSTESGFSLPGGHKMYGSSAPDSQGYEPGSYIGESRLCNADCGLWAQVTLYMQDEAFFSLHQTVLFKRINKAIFVRGIQLIDTKNHTFLRLHKWESTGDCF